MDKQPKRSIASLILASAMVAALFLVVVVVSNSGPNPSGQFAYALEEGDIQISDRIYFEFSVPKQRARLEVRYQIDEPYPVGTVVGRDYDFYDLIGLPITDDLAASGVGPGEAITVELLKTCFEESVGNESECLRRLDALLDSEYGPLITWGSATSWGSIDDPGPAVEFGDGVWSNAFNCTVAADGVTYYMDGLIGQPTPDGGGTIDRQWFYTRFNGAGTGEECVKRLAELQDDPTLGPLIKDSAADFVQIGDGIEFDPVNHELLVRDIQQFEGKTLTGSYNMSWLLGLTDPDRGQVVTAAWLDAYFTDTAGDESECLRRLNALLEQEWSERVIERYAAMVTLPETGGGYIDVQATLDWEGYEEPLPESVECSLWRRSSTGGDILLEDTVTLRQEDGWTYTWKDRSDGSDWFVEADGMRLLAYDVHADFGNGQKTFNAVIAMARTNPDTTPAPTSTPTPPPPPDDGDTTNVSVTVDWVDNGRTRPEFVKCVLQRRLETETEWKNVEEVLLSAADNWQYIWEGLPGEYQWLVGVVKPSNYNGEVRDDAVKYQFICTMTGNLEESPPPASQLPAPTPTVTPPRPTPTPSPAPKPSRRPSSGGGGGGGGGSSTHAPTATPRLPAPELVTQPSQSPASPSPGQPAVRREKSIVDWGDRVGLPDYGVGLYETLDRGGDSLFNGCLIQDDSFILPAGMSGSPGWYTVATVEQVDFDLAEMFSSGKVSLGTASFSNEDFYRVDASQSDHQINYAALRMGDVVRTPTFNGVFVTSVPRTQSFDEDKKQTCTYISTVFQAFDRDHPEVFWLSGKCRVRIISASSASGGQDAYFFLVLVDDNSFSMRAPAWNTSGAVTSGIQRRDQAVAKILGTVTGAAPAEQVRQINRWLTQHNEYNTTPDLTTIGNEPHECLSALEGRSGRDGPVCDGYARAFKVLCDQLGIPCVLENGYAKTSPGSKGVLHMWNAVQIGGSWYGVDVTWNDPVPQRSNGAVSGYESEEFLLVGSGTKIRDMTFAASHPATNRAAADGISFSNGPVLSATALSETQSAPVTSKAPAASKPPAVQTLPSGQIFSDVPKGSWYYDAVNYVYRHKMMVGTEPQVFSPNGITTRQELWMILARMDGANPADMQAARTWAVNLKLTNGVGATGYLSRQEFAATLHHYCALKGYNTFSIYSLEKFPDRGSIAGYAQTGMAWAVGHRLLLGTDEGKLEPVGTTTRAEMATILMRFQEDFAK